MVNLSADECRVLGVLVEKATTTPDQYPLTVNALVNGCNQKNNRDPVTSLDEDAVLDALNALREKGLVMRVDMAGSRVPKYRHLAIEKLGVSKPGLVVLAELLLRGPQTLGELRSRGGRMYPFESLEVVKTVIEALMGGEEPLVREVPPAPGSRAERIAQLLNPDLHPLNTSASEGAVETAGAGPSGSPLAQRVAELEAEVKMLREGLRKLAEAVGEGDDV